MIRLRPLWLVLAVWGAVHPLFWVGVWFWENGVDPMGLIGSWMGELASRSLAWDLVISAVALTLWVLAEVAVRRNWKALWAIPATFCIGVSCGLPLYLWFRSEPV